MIESIVDFDTPLDLPCGYRLKNRFVKSAMNPWIAVMETLVASGLAGFKRRRA